MDTEIKNPERRAFTRHRARTRVRIRAGALANTCQCIDLSAGGCAVKGVGLGLTKNTSVDITFIIDLGNITKLHRRTARVAHITNGITGFALQAYKEKHDYGHSKEVDNT